MLRWSDRGAEPGIVGCVEDPVRTDRVIGDIAGKDCLISYRHSNAGVGPNRQRARSRAWRKIAQRLNQPLKRQHTAPGNILAKGHEVMLGVTCEDCAVWSDGEDGIAVDRPRLGFFPLRAAGEQDTRFGQQPPQRDPCATILCMEPRPGGFGPNRRSKDPGRADREKSRRMSAFREVLSHLAFCAMLGCTTRTCMPPSEAGSEVASRTTPKPATLSKIAVAPVRRSIRRWRSARPKARAASDAHSTSRNPSP